MPVRNCIGYAQGVPARRAERRWDDSPDVLSDQLSHAPAGVKTPLTKSGNPGIHTSRTHTHVSRAHWAEGGWVSIQTTQGIHGLGQHPRSEGRSNSGPECAAPPPPPTHSLKIQPLDTAGKRKGRPAKELKTMPIVNSDGTAGENSVPMHISQLKAARAQTAIDYFRPGAAHFPP